MFDRDNIMLSYALQFPTETTDEDHSVLTLWLVNWPKQASNKSAVFPEPAKIGQNTIG